MGKIGVRSYMKGDYEEIYALKAAKKQSQSKPIYLAPRPALGVEKPS
jgi:hypothetical protein